MKQKIVDTSLDISEGGRARMYWAARKVSGKQQKLTQSKQKEVDLQAILKTYNLKGFEFGNWLNNEERYDHVLACQSALLDLAAIIGSKNIGMDTLIGIAFGARGTSNAAAHYEPRLNMINLTKKTGAGCLAHEYGHAIDYNFGRYIDQHKVYDALTGGHNTSDKGVRTGAQFRILANIIVDCAKDTESYHKLKKANLSEYWYRRTEVFARAFEQYIAYRLRKKGKRNNYLAHTWSYYTINKGYWTEKDFQKIIDWFDRFISYLSEYLKGKGKLVSITASYEPEQKAAATKRKTTKK